MMMSLKLISLNIEASNHLATILPWFQQEQPDVVCLQEVFKIDFPIIKAALDMEGEFVAMVNVGQPNEYRLEPRGELGLAMLTKLSHLDFQHEYYLKHGNQVPELIDGQPNSGDRAIIWTTVTQAGQSFTIASTHFTWSPAGQLIPLQETTYESMLKILTKIPELILCGDFNSPRSRGGIYDRLATQYQDHMPVHLDTTIDGQLHRAGPLKFVVDGLFSSPEYLVNQVQVMGGLSDHMAIVAELSKKI